MVHVLFLFYYFVWYILEHPILMYLIHYSVVMQLMKYFFPTEGLSNSNLIIYLSIYVVITLIGSYLLYAFFEKPMTNLRDTTKIKNRFK